MLYCFRTFSWWYFGWFGRFFPLYKLGVISVTVKFYDVTVGRSGVVSDGHLLAVEGC